MKLVSNIDFVCLRKCPEHVLHLYNLIIWNMIGDLMIVVEAEEIINQRGKMKAASKRLVWNRTIQDGVLDSRNIMEAKESNGFIVTQSKGAI